MRTFCLNCERPLRWFKRPSTELTWQCVCGAINYHTVSSYVESWGRPTIAAGMILGLAGACFLRWYGVFGEVSTARTVGLCLLSGALVASVLLAIAGPIAVVVASCLKLEQDSKEKVAAVFLWGVSIAWLAMLALAAPRAISGLEKRMSHAPADPSKNGSPSATNDKN